MQLPNIVNPTTRAVLYYVFTISGKIIGHPLNLYVHESGAKWVKDVHGFTVGFPNNFASLENLVLAFQLKLPQFLPPSLENMLRVLNVDSRFLSKLIPSNKYLELVTNYAKDLRNIYEKVSASAYQEIFIQQSRFLNSLEPAKIHLPSFVSRLSVTKNSSSLSTFKPDSNGFAAPVVYDRHSTVTGRMKVKSGPMVLTLSQTDRCVIKPSVFGHKIYYADFVSLEPRLLLKYLGKPVSSDVYTGFCKKYNLQVERTVAKRAVVSALYGASAKKLDPSLSSNQQFVLMKKVREYFETESTIKYLESDIRNGVLLNMFGRPIEVGAIRGSHLLNWWIQSSAVDAALIGFHQLTSNFKCRPLFVIHDALILEAASPPPTSVSIKEFGEFPLQIEEYQHN